MRVKEFITEADFAAWKNNRNPSAPAGSTPTQAAQNAGVIPATPTTPGNLADLAKLGAPKKTSSSFGDKMDWLKGQMHRFGGGMFGPDGGIAATKNIFINNFAQEYSQITNSAKRSGMTVPDMKTYITDYLEQHGWNATPQQIDQIVTSSGNNIRNIANGVYVIGMQNTRAGAAGGNRVNQPQVSSTTSDGQPVELTTGTGKILQAIDKMSGSTNSDDLEKIALGAMNKLYGISKSDYAALRADIIKGKQTTPAQTVSESITKTRKISNRNK